MHVETDDPTCRKHPWEVAEAACRRCRDDFCGSDLVYVHGPDQPALCVPCALALSAARRGARAGTRRRWRVR